MTQVATPLLHICKVAEAERCMQAKHGYSTADQNTVGFMHLSTVELLLIPANKFYLGQTDLVLLVIDPDRLAAELRWEPGVPAEGELLFPHLYGPLNPDAVTQVIGFPAGDDGRFSLPQQLVEICS